MRTNPQRPTVMIVEDEFLIADQLDEWVRSDGMIPLGPAPTVKAAQDLLDIFAKPDAAVLDVNLRGQTVFPILVELEARGVPFVFFTGYSREALPLSHRNAPILMKPTGEAEFLSYVRAMIDKPSRDAGAGVTMIPRDRRRPFFLN